MVSRMAATQPAYYPPACRPLFAQLRVTCAAALTAAAVAAGVCSAPLGRSRINCGDTSLIHKALARAYRSVEVYKSHTAMLQEVYHTTQRARQPFRPFLTKGNSHIGDAPDHLALNALSGPCTGLHRNSIMGPLARTSQYQGSSGAHGSHVQVLTQIIFRQTRTNPAPR